MIQLIGHGTQCYSSDESGSISCARRVTLIRPLINCRRNSPFFLPLGLLSISAALRESGFKVRIVDYEYLYRMEEFSSGSACWLQDTCDPLIAENPIFVGITALADTLPTCLLMGRYIKQHAPETPVVMGGPGVFGVLPRLLEEYNDCVDYVCINEGEVCTVELAERIVGGEERPSVAGFWARAEGRVVNSDCRGLADLNHLPMPAYDMIPMESYLRLSSPRIFDTYLGTGCTHACKFCVTAPFWERKFRAKNPEIILRELDYLYYTYGITKFNFLHDNLSNNKRYLSIFIDYFLEQNTRYEWGCAMRPDNIDHKLLQKMRLAGCTHIFCGIDSGSRSILRAMHKMSEVSHAYFFLENCRGLGFHFETNTIIGYPDETDADLEASLRLVFLAVANGAANSDVSVLQPLPGASVTAENLHHLELIRLTDLGTFLPEEAIELACNDKELFTGFCFIRKNNRDFDWYLRMSNLVRFFTRHWFRTIYFLVQECGFTYTYLFSHMVHERDPSQWGFMLGRLIKVLDLPAGLRPIVEAIFAYDEVGERIRCIDVRREVQNVYAVPRTLDIASRYAFLECSRAVHKIFGNMPQLLLSDGHKRPASYVFWRNAEGGVTTIFLNWWQRDLWHDTSRHGPSEKIMASFIAELLRSHPHEKDRVEETVRQTALFFSRIINSSLPLTDSVMPQVFME